MKVGHTESAAQQRAQTVIEARGGTITGTVQEVVGDLVQPALKRGARRRQGSITKTGNAHARRALIEEAWAYRYPARVRRRLQPRLEQVPKGIQEISGKAQVRLCKRYRQLVARGKHVNQVVVAIARELAAFVWAIVGEVEGTQRAQRPAA